MRRITKQTVFLIMLWAGLIGFAHAQPEFKPPYNPDGLNCLFYPLVHDTSGYNAYILKETVLAPAQIAKARKVFDYFEAEYRVAEVRIYIPCKYYADMSFLMNISLALFAPGDDFPEIIWKEKK